MELVGIAEGEIDGVANDGRGSDDEDKRRPGIAGDSIGDGQSFGRAADGKDGRGAEAVENPTDKNDAADEFAEGAQFAGGHQDARPHAETDDGGGRSLKTGMNFGEFFEEEIVVGHGVEDAGSGEQNAVSGAEGGNEDGERNDFAGPGAEDLCDGGGGDGVAGGHAGGAEGEEVGDDGEKIEADKNQRAGEKGSGEILLWFDDFTGAVGSELPAFVGPENSDHRQAEIGPETDPVLSGAQGGRNFAGVMADGQKHGAEDHDDADLDEGGPVLKIGALACAPDIYGGDNGDHDDGDDGLAHRRNRKDFCEIFAEHTREGGDGAAGDDEKETPAVEEGGHAAKSIANVAVEAAGFGVCGSELCVGERAEQGEDAADGPHEERERDGAAHLAKNGAWRSKDAGADDRADEKQQEIAESECAEKWRHF